MRITNLILCFLLCGGVALVITAGLERQRLLGEFRRLDEEHGFLPVEDANRVYVRRMPGKDALHCRFRIHLPPGQMYLWKHRSGQGATSGFQDPREIQAQTRIRFDPAKDCLMAFYDYDSGSATMSLQNGEAGRFINDHLDQMEITTLDLGETRSYSLDEVVRLVQIRMSDALFAEVSERFPDVAKWRGDIMLEFSLGTTQAFAATDEKRANH